MAGIGALVMAWELSAASPLWAGYPTSVIFSTFASSATSDVPGHSEKKFRFQGNISLVSPTASPDGSRWAIAALVSDPAPIDSQWLIVGNGPSAASAQVLLIPGVTPVPGEPAHVFTGINAPWMPINNNGQFAFAAQTSASQDVVTRFNGSDFELIARPGADSPLPSVPYGNFHSDAHILANGQVSFVSTNDAAGEQIIYRNSDLSNGSVMARTGVTVPAAQLTTPAQTLGFIQWHQLRTDATAAHQIYNALLDGPTDTGAVVVLDGHVVAQRGHPVPGFSNTVPLLNVHFVDVSSYNGHWLFAGSVDDGTHAGNATDFVSFNSNIVASTGSPLYVGSTEKWHDAGTTNTFYWAQANSHGDYVIAGLTNTGAQALVLNGAEVLLRSGDPIDLDGNGLFDDEATVAFLSTSFRGAGAVLADNGSLYLTAGLTVQGQLAHAFMVIQLPAVVPEPAMPILLSPLFLLRPRRPRPGTQTIPLVWRF